MPFFCGGVSKMGVVGTDNRTAVPADITRVPDYKKAPADYKTCFPDNNSENIYSGQLPWVKMCDFPCFGEVKWTSAFHITG